MKVNFVSANAMVDGCFRDPKRAISVRGFFLPIPIMVQGAQMVGLHVVRAAHDVDATALPQRAVTPPAFDDV